MYLLSAFRVSTYLTLLMACMALGYSEIGLLPEIPLIMAFSVILLILGFAMEGHWALSLGAANMLGGFLTAMLGVWVAYQFVRPSIGLAEQIPMPVRLLPYLGPVLMILIPFKLFRPKLHADYWAMQGIGLLAVALGCAMAHDGVFGFLMVVYLFAFVWSMTLFYLGRCAGVIETEAGKPSPELGTKHRWLMFRTTGRWSVLIVGISVPLFLITPRPGENRWELPYAARGRMETGISTSDVDLNRIGGVDNNEEIAFEVYAEDRSGNPKTDVDPNQYWRVASLHQYDRGRWLRDKNSGLNIRNLCSARSVSSSEADRPLHLRFPQGPDFGPNQYYLAFTPHRQALETRPLAYPVYWRGHEPSPVVVWDGTRTVPVWQLLDGSFDWSTNRRNRVNEISHVQTTISVQDSQVGPAMYFNSNAYIEPLTRIPDVKRISQWTSDLLAQLVQEGKLAPTTRTELDSITGKPLAKHHAAIARALESYLAFSKEYHYTLQLRRQDRTIDPVEDFLFNTKSGHCQRYATALAVMLRSQGIPTRFVLGFKGFASSGQGNYIVRQNQAHAWVEALIPDKSEASLLFNVTAAYLGAPAAVARLGPFGERIPLAYRWLALDPTPAADEVGETDKSLTGWFESSMTKWSDWFRQFILGYNERLRGQTVAAILESIEAGWMDFLEGKLIWPWYALVVGMGLVVLRQLRRSRRRWVVKPGIAVLFQARLLAILARSGFSPTIGQTPKEFARTVTAKLARQTETREVATIPEAVIDLYYRVCYGGKPLTAAEQEEVNGQLRQLESAVLAVVHPLA